MTSHANLIPDIVRDDEKFLKTIHPTLFHSFILGELCDEL